MSWKIRCIFIVVCIGVVLFLGHKRNLIAGLNQEYADYPIVINEVMTNNRNSIRDDEGDFEDWVEIYNAGDTAVNLQNFGLSNNERQPFLWTLPHKVIEPKSFCIVWISGKNKTEPDFELHTNFKFKNKDKAIILTAPDKYWKDIFLLQPMGDNISYGRANDGSSDIYGFDQGTPGKANEMEVLAEGPSTKRLSPPSFSHSGGFYTQEFSLALSSYDSEAEIYYTMDGTIPTERSTRYTKPIIIQEKINKATVIRARSYRKGYPKSELATNSYFVCENIYGNYNVPVISLVTDPDNLFDYERGIYVTGKVFDEWRIENPDSKITWATPANYNQRGKNWEREASIELFETNGAVGLKQNIGIRIHGGYSRAEDLKTISLRTRKDYDDKDCFDYDFFDKKAKKFVNNSAINQFSCILLRASATDRKHSFFRDAFIQSLVKNSNILNTQSSKPCILYINGEYYGIHNIREIYDKNYISNYYDMNTEDIVIVNNPTGIAGVEIQEGYAGDEMHYNRMIQYIEEHGAKSENDYEFIETKMDIDNFIDYNILQIYCDNRDWPGNNVRIWRKRTQAYEPDSLYGHDGRWRWLVFDLDYGFGLFRGESTVQDNSLEMATQVDGPDYPNPPWSTFLLRSLLENESFKNQFINTFADRLNTIYLPEVVLNRIEAMEEIYYPNVAAHIARWRLHKNNVENWINEVDAMKKFARNRPQYIYQHIIDYFGLVGTAAIKVHMNEGGAIKINSVYIADKDTMWEGNYFMDIPITVQAIPSPGFMFAGWEGVVQSEEKTVVINLKQSSYLKAHFKEI